MRLPMKAGGMCAAALAAAFVLASPGAARRAGAQADEKAGVVAQGQRLFVYHCAPCHAAGPRHPGTDALRLKYDGAIPPVLTDRTDLTPEAVRFFVRNGVNAMPYFRKTEIGDQDLDAIGSYLSRRRR